MERTGVLIPPCLVSTCIPRAVREPQERGITPPPKSLGGDQPPPPRVEVGPFPGVQACIQSCTNMYIADIEGGNVESTPGEMRWPPKAKK